MRAAFVVTYPLARRTSSAAAAVGAASAARAARAASTGTGPACRKACRVSSSQTAAAGVPAPKTASATVLRCSLAWKKATISTTRTPGSPR